MRSYVCASWLEGCVLWQACFSVILTLKIHLTIFAFRDEKGGKSIEDEINKSSPGTSFEFITSLLSADFV